MMYTLEDPVSDYAIDPAPQMEISETDKIVFQDLLSDTDDTKLAESLDIEQDTDTLREQLNTLPETAENEEVRQLVTECALLRKRLEKKHFYNNLSYVTESIYTYGNLQDHLDNERIACRNLIARLFHLRRT